MVLVRQASLRLDLASDHLEGLLKHSARPRPRVSNSVDWGGAALLISLGGC